MAGRLMATLTYLTLLTHRGQFGLELGVYGAPETFLVDSQGIIRALSMWAI